MTNLAPFDYATLSHNEEVVRGIVKRINTKVRTLAESVFAIGRELSLARKLIGDRFYEWADAEFGFKERSIRNYCRVYEQLGDYEDRMTTMPPSTLYLLAGECVPPEAIETAIARAESGEKVTASDAKEIIAESLDYVETVSDEPDEPDDQPEQPAASNAGKASKPKPNTSPLWDEVGRCIERALEIYRKHAQECDEAADVIADLERTQERHTYYVKGVETT